MAHGISRDRPFSGTGRPARRQQQRHDERRPDGDARRRDDVDAASLHPAPGRFVERGIKTADSKCNRTILRGSGWRNPGPARRRLCHAAHAPQSAPTKGCERRQRPFMAGHAANPRTAGRLSGAIRPSYPLQIRQRGVAIKLLPDHLRRRNGQRRDAFGRPRPSPRQS